MLHNNVEFHAIYNYGPQEECIKKRNVISEFFHTFFVRLFKPFLFPGAMYARYCIIDPMKVKQSKIKLTELGGVSIRLHTPDGDKLEGMFLSTSNFKSQIKKYCEVTTEEVTDNEFYTKLTLKTVDHKEDKRVADAFYDLISADSKLQIQKPERAFQLEIIPCKPEGLNGAEGHSTPTVIIAPAAGSFYSFYTKLALSYLNMGMNVMLVNYRGYGESTGSPTEHKTKLDLETTYQYLHSIQKIKNQHIVVHGQCLGGGPATDLAARRKGVHLILDRSFANYRDLAVKMIFTGLRKITALVIPYLVDYKNGENIQKIQGHIAIIKDQQDEMIDKQEEAKIINSLPSNEGQIIKVIDTNVGHNGIWLNEDYPREKWIQFLVQTELTRTLF